tara:strand:- start:10589 stop:10834 length:246 start_codon:yes stop_codon:yes gene_type:complete
MTRILIPTEEFIEFTSTIAGRMTEERFASSMGGSDCFEEDEDGTVRFTEEAQDFFNDTYDTVEDLMNDILGVYRKTNLPNE